MVRKLPVGRGTVHRRTDPGAADRATGATAGHGDIRRTRRREAGLRCTRDPDRSPVAGTSPSSKQAASVIWVAVGTALALLAAVLFAFGTVLQQRGTMSVYSSDDNPRFLLQILAPTSLAGGRRPAGFRLGRAGHGARSSRAPRRPVANRPEPRDRASHWDVADQSAHRATRAGRRDLDDIGIVVFLSGGQPQGGISHPSAGILVGSLPHYLRSRRSPLRAWAGALPALRERSRSAPRPASAMGCKRRSRRRS